MDAFQKNISASLVCVDVVEYGESAQSGWPQCVIGENLRFDSSGMESYFFAEWDPVLYDALVVAGAVEFCDRKIQRHNSEWRRRIRLRVPVHEPDIWSHGPASDDLRDALTFLTGDHWILEFHERKRSAARPRPGRFDLGNNTHSIIPVSDGMDSNVAAMLAARELGNRLVRVHLGTKKFPSNSSDVPREPFTAVPYEVRKGKWRFGETSMRSRGFKFALISAIAAHLSGAERIIVPESGQGVIGPSILPVGHAYPDYRSHPRFSRKMEKFLRSLIGFKGRYDHPHMWDTKGETLTRFMEETRYEAGWMSTRSCWQQNRHVAFGGKSRQCGICASCMLRRLSVHASGQEEPPGTYTWEDLDAPTFEAGASPGFDKITGALKEHAVAGTLHLEHLSRARFALEGEGLLSTESSLLGRSLGMHQDVAREKMKRLLGRHSREWEGFIASLKPESFVVQWVQGVRP